MRPIPPGYRTHQRIVVTDAMTVDFEQDDPRLGRLHPVYATYWLAKHMELVSRRIILPFLEEDEEGIGFEVQVTHRASALPGMGVTLEAEFERLDGNRVYARCRAVSELDDVVGTGATTQVILPRAALERSFARLGERWDARRSASGTRGSESGTRGAAPGPAAQDRDAGRDGAPVGTRPPATADDDAPSEGEQP